MEWAGIVNAHLRGEERLIEWSQLFRKKAMDEAGPDPGRGDLVLASTFHNRPVYSAAMAQAAADLVPVV
ncbi:MAG: hypothetical protein ACOCXA_07305 [Planctomycetota bacterium]